MSNSRRSAPAARSALSVKITLPRPLPKAATFSSPISPPLSPKSDSCSTFNPPSLLTRGHSNLDDVIEANLRRAALVVSEFDKTLAAVSKLSLASPPPSPDPSKPVRDDDCEPLPRTLLHHTLDSIMARGPLSDRTLKNERNMRVRRPNSDSGLGSSIASSTKSKRSSASAVGNKKSAKPTTVTRAAAAARTAADAETAPVGLSKRATSRICEYTLKPLLSKPAFREFHPVLLECPGKMLQKKIICLRDVEKTILDAATETAKTAAPYLDFCFATIRCLQATVDTLTEREQTRPRDLPYNSGYFVDLVDQIRQYAEQLSGADEAKGKDTMTMMDLDPTDEIKLHGGIHINGRPAQLVRVKKNGKAISLATGEVIDVIDEEPAEAIRFKRSASQQLEDDEEVMRSMARRRKNASAEELAPKRCREPGCNKEFKRPCDLTKHEKTHSRPWKCPVPTCKYHEYGWPTEKEMDRHHNDKHSSAPPMFECLYKPCPYKSKRESNCKQHMEKAHGWVYVRTKTNGNRPSLSARGAGSVEPTPLLQNMPTPSSEASMGAQTPPDYNHNRFYGSGLEFASYMPDNMGSFSHMSTDLSLDHYSSPPPLDRATPASSVVSMDHNSAYQDIGTDFGVHDDIYGVNHVQLPAHNMYAGMFQKEQLPQPHQLPQQQFATYSAPAIAPTQISPVGHGNTMLFTPESLTHDGFDDHADYNHMGASNDFVLFPQRDNLAKPHPGMFNGGLFGAELPSLAGGYSQPCSQDLLNVAMNVDWSQYSFNTQVQH